MRRGDFYCSRWSNLFKFSGVRVTVKIEVVVKKLKDSHLFLKIISTLSRPSVSCAGLKKAFQNKTNMCCHSGSHCTTPVEIHMARACRLPSHGHCQHSRGAQVGAGQVGVAARPALAPLCGALQAVPLLFSLDIAYFSSGSQIFEYNYSVSWTSFSSQFSSGSSKV